MNMYKFGNYICKLREEKNLTQAELASKLDVSDKSISKWENGQAFPRIETFEKLAAVLDTTVEDIFSASKDGVNRICIENEFAFLMQIDVNGQPYAIRGEESKWIEIDSDTAVIKITGDLITEDSFGELEELASFKDKIMLKAARKMTSELMDLCLQADCVYKITNIEPESIITVEIDGFDLGDKAWVDVNFGVCYPKLICSDNIKTELVSATGKNRKQVIKSFKRLGLWADLGMGFFEMIAFYPLRGLYFKHLCKPYILKENIINAEHHKAKSEKRKKGKNLGCFGGCLSFVGLLLILFIVSIISDIIFVDSDKPYLVAADYSTITYQDDVYVRIDELPEYAYETTFFGATVWENARTHGLSKWDQSLQDNMVKLYEDAEGRAYLWLVEEYVDTILSAKENGDDKDYEDFDEHYVYVCEDPQ